VVGSSVNCPPISVQLSQRLLAGWLVGILAFMKGCSVSRYALFPQLYNSYFFFINVHMCSLACPRKHGDERKYEELIVLSLWLDFVVLLLDLLVYRSLSAPPMSYIRTKFRRFLQYPKYDIATIQEPPDDICHVKGKQMRKTVSSKPCDAMQIYRYQNPGAVSHYSAFNRPKIFLIPSAPSLPVSPPTRPSNSPTIATAFPSSTFETFLQ